MLVSRVAGLGELRHRPIGFTGPLSQHLLGYNSIINVVRQTLRDMVEIASTHMFLTGCCNRSAVDLSKISMKFVTHISLPFPHTNTTQTPLPPPFQLRTQHRSQILPRRTPEQRCRPHFPTNKNSCPRDCVNEIFPAVGGLCGRFEEGV